VPSLNFKRQNLSPQAKFRAPSYHSASRGWKVAHSKVDWSESRQTGIEIFFLDETFAKGISKRYLITETKRSKGLTIVRIVPINHVRYQKSNYTENNWEYRSERNCLSRSCRIMGSSNFSS
jgi:hypothetical protein